MTWGIAFGEWDLFHISFSALSSFFFSVPIPYYRWWLLKWNKYLFPLNYHKILSRVQTKQYIERNKICKQGKTSRICKRRVCLWDLLHSKATERPRCESNQSASHFWLWGLALTFLYCEKICGSWERIGFWSLTWQECIGVHSWE